MSEVEPRGVRVTDADRERVLELLKEHVVSGSLTSEELTLRSEQALAARSHDELERLTRDLPGPPEPPLPVRLAARVPLSLHVGAWVVVNAILLVVWGATRERDSAATDEGFGQWWPFWIMLVWGILLVAHALYALRRPALRGVDPPS